jgi:glycosyltransferase involved in cell wall biosynthesis
VKKAIIGGLALCLGVLGYLAPKFWHQKEVAQNYPVTEQKAFVIVVPSYNNAKWYDKNLASIEEQEYDNYRVIYIDDNSNDGMSEKVQAWIERSPIKEKIEYIRNPVNRGAMYNHYVAIHDCKDAEIIVHLDGDDWLSHPHVLKRLNEIYANPDVWVTYGSHIEYPTYKRGETARAIPGKIKEKGIYRSHRFCASHLRSGYAGLFKRIKLQDLYYDGKLYDAAPDMALMFPVLEMAASHAHFVKEIFYVYNRSNPLNEDKVKFARSQAIDHHIRARNKYEPVASIFQESIGPKKADLVIFSYDRPLQLYALLESIENNMSDLGEQIVIYRSSSSEFDDAYSKVKERFPKIQFWKQGENPKDDFKPLVMKAIFQTPSQHVLFAVDDIILRDSVKISECISALEEHNAYGFYLRLGSNIDSSYMNNVISGKPPLISVGSGLLAWQFQSGSQDWKYPNTVDMTVYKKSDIRQRLEKVNFTTPNWLECRWAGKADMTKVGLCFVRSKIVNIPLNLVNTDEISCANRHMKSYSTRELLDKFKAGLKMNTSPLKDVDNRAAHIEYEVTFVKR